MEVHASYKLCIPVSPNPFGPCIPQRGRLKPLHAAPWALNPKRAVHQPFQIPCEYNLNSFPLKEEVILAMI